MLFRGLPQIKVQSFLFLSCNRHNSFLSLGGPQLYNSEALPFTYDQYVVIELADKLCYCLFFCVSPWIFIQINNFCQRSNHLPLDYKASALPLHQGGPTLSTDYQNSAWLMCKGGSELKIIEKYYITELNQGNIAVVRGVEHVKSSIFRRRIEAFQIFLHKLFFPNFALVARVSPLSKYFYTPNLTCLLRLLYFKIYFNVSVIWAYENVLI